MAFLQLNSLQKITGTGKLPQKLVKDTPPIWTSQPIADKRVSLRSYHLRETLCNSAAMRILKFTCLSLLVIIFCCSCTKQGVEDELTDQTYFILVTNTNVNEVELSVSTSIDKKKTFIIGGVSDKKIKILATPGEYVKFKVTNKGGCIYEVLDSKGVKIATYNSLPNSTGNWVELDFIAFPTNDQEKDFLKYKTGTVRKIADQLIGKHYKLDERYYLENGIKTYESGAQLPCTYGDAYNFITSRGENGNFNPNRLVFSTEIVKAKSSCLYGPGPIVPTNGISVVTNEDNTISFPIWDNSVTGGSTTNMSYRHLQIDSIEEDGTFVLFQKIGDNKKEIFVYKPE